MPNITPAQEQYLADVNSPWKMRLFLLQKLPSMLFWGGRVDKLTTKHCVASLPYGWRSQNPFSSIYFAAQSGVAELTTGLLVITAIKAHQRKVAMYVIDFQAQFTKKATERIYYRCEQGEDIQAAVDRSIATGEAQVIECISVGKTASGQEVGRARITWSVKAK